MAGDESSGKIDYTTLRRKLEVLAGYDTSETGALVA